MPDPALSSRTLADLIADDYEHISVSCCRWITHVPLDRIAFDHPDITGAQMAARLICHRCGKRPTDYKIERSATYGIEPWLDHLTGYRPRRD